jgi:RNA polymerase sigma factor (sigma-70 family)
MLGDERLAKLAGRGSTRAFAALYERHHQAVYRYCRSIVGNEHDAQDALQSAMMRAFAALRGEQRDLAVKPWLFRIAHNEAVTILRRRRPELELDEQAELHALSPPEPGGLEHAVQTRERLATLVSDLQALPERQRGALVMRELNGLSMREIAQALAISPGAAKQTLFEARTSLHELAEGRAMQCEAVRQAISARDGRVLRGRRIRAHLRACEDCQTFREAIATRQADLRALAPPLPAASAGAILLRLLAHGGGGHAGGAAAATYSAASAGSGGSLGGHAVASLAVKALAGVAVMAAATAGTVRLAGGGHRHHQSARPAAVTGGASGPGGQATQGGRSAGGGAASAGTAGGSASGASGAAGRGQAGGQPSTGPAPGAASGATGAASPGGANAHANPRALERTRGSATSPRQPRQRHAAGPNHSQSGAKHSQTGTSHSRGKSHSGASSPAGSKPHPVHRRPPPLPPVKARPQPVPNQARQAGQASASASQREAARTSR